MSHSLSSPRAIGDWINCSASPLTWNGTNYTLQRTGGSMKYTSNDGTAAIWTYCNSTGGNSPSSDTVKRLASGYWEDGPGSRPSGNNNIRESNNVLFVTHGSNHTENVWGFDDPYDISSGGGTSTEGVATVGDAVGSLVDYPSFSEINASITADSPGGSNYSYTVLKDNVQIAQINSHSNGTATSFDVDYSTVGRFGVWDFTVMEVSTVTVRHLARLTIVDPNARKNVFRNFW